MSKTPKKWSNAQALADAIIEETSGHVVLAVPLGLGKPNHFVNAIFRKACADKSVSLKIYTALTLERPIPKSEMEGRFLGPLIERLFDGYVDLDYARALRGGELPPNIEIVEFFLAAGRWLGVEAAQQNYVSANYTDACGYILEAGINVAAQMVATRHDAVDQTANQETYSLSCNPDLTLDILKARHNGDANFRFVGEISDELPFMGHDAEIAATEFDHVLEGDCTGSRLFSTPKRPVRLADYAAGFHAARLIPDGGSLQIGIGSMGDAIAHALIMRHKNNEAYRAIVNQLAPNTPPPSPCDDHSFSEGLYGVSEMLVDTFLDLIEAGIVKREVDGCVVHSAFFLGPKSFYRKLRDMSQSARDKIGMTSVNFVNDVHEQFEQKQSDRRHARFINNGMIATLLGAVVSDGLDSGQVVSGVGGQFDFVRQAFALKGARSIIMLNALRERGTKTNSNIVWTYAHQTIPRHLRDMIVTEYGVADLRGKGDADVITAMLSVADARFHGALIASAREAGKLPKNFMPPDRWKFNTPKSIETVLCTARDEGLLPEFPFGSDFTDTEIDLLSALERMKRVTDSRGVLASLILKGATKRTADSRELRMLDRMGLAHPKGLKERISNYLLRGAIDL